MDAPPRPIEEGWTLSGRLGWLRGRPVLFSAAGGIILALNETAADIWRHLEDGLSPAAIAAELRARGVEAELARAYAESALGEWTRLGLADRRPRRAPEDPAPAAQVLELGGRRIRVACHGDFAPLAALFRHLAAPEGQAAATEFALLAAGGRAHLFRDGVWQAGAASDEAAVLLKGQLLTEILEHGDQALALHAAALLRDGRLLLLGGPPGTGKTTLALALAAAGFGFAGDDVALLYPDGRCAGLPFAPAVKSGAVALLAPRMPGLVAAPAHRRPDRRRVRFPLPDAPVRSRPRPVGWILRLRRRPGMPARLDPLDPAEALRFLLGEAFAAGGELTAEGFDAVCAAISGAETHVLTYSDLDQAVALLARALR
ncbi:PqqD family peptide modification chaperone [Amaricoccus solimangrovi]|uniref:PqqD family peptide modification chaperone n=1 Tax=Amaricoccus solimangrovi TaxID=2589815 RepID=A0A501WLW3_9RHOB|nr:PqqD family peptide modification chaperone [Amaricoccus solimangrovi]TPE49144.1 PqqD family peptide modification chaperone [Amaricoccus solimangrovi]